MYWAGSGIPRMGIPFLWVRESRTAACQSHPELRALIVIQCEWIIAVPPNDLGLKQVLISTAAV
jgi:hypothetical protein